MELIYFISGIITVGAIYSVFLLRHIKSSHTSLLARQQSISNLSSIRYGEVKEELEGLGMNIREVQDTMERDQYASIAEINVKLEELFSLTESNARKQNDSNKVHTKNVADAFNEIQQLKNNLKALGQDPNFLNRY